MHGDIGRIPIFSFSSCKPLTDILPELPIPKSTHVSIGDKTLLYDSELVLDAFRCINATDDRVVRLLAPAIASVSVDDIEFQDEYSKPSSTTQSPSLLKSLLGKDAFSLHLGYNKENPVIKLKLPPDILVSSNSETYPTKTNVSQGSNNVTTGAAGESGFGSYSAICIAPLRISLKKNSNCDSPKAVKLRKPKKHHPTLQGEHKVSQDAETDTGGTIEGTNGNQTFQPTCSTEPTSGSDSVTKTPNVHVRPSPTEAPSSENGFTSSGGAFLSIMSNSSSVDVDGSARLRSLCELKQLPGNPPPESDFSRSITPPAASLPSTDPGTLRRVPDPEISQLFHSAALFHAYQPHCEQENIGHCAGGGLFDDWIDSPLKSNVIPQVINPPSSADCAQSLSVSSPSSSAGAVCPSNHIPYSAGVGIDLPLCFSRSPQSVMSNHSSYPTTPGDGLSSVPAVLAGLPASVPSPPLHLKYANIHSTMHPSIRLFDDPKSKTPLLEAHVEEQPRIAPHGLAAYLPRSSSLRPQSTNSGHSDIVAEGLRSMSPKSCASPDRAFSGPNSVGTVESSSGPSSTNKGFATAPLSVNASCSRASCDPSPTSRTSFGGRFAGRKVRGGRRRRTEVEELRIWNVNDHAQPEMGPKSGNIAQFSTGVAVDTSRQTEDKGPALLGAVESPLPDFAGPSHSKDFSITESVADHGVFTEALVERVKRRRQQREVGSQRRQTNHSDITSVRSLELSPESTSSPAQPSAICMANTAFFGYGSSHDNRSLLPPVHSIQPKRPHTRSSESDTSSPSNVVFVSSIGPTRSNEFISARSVSPLLSTTQKQHTITCTAPSSKPASLGSSIEPSFPISCQSSSCDIDNLMNSTERMTVISSRSHLRVPDLQKSIPSRLDTAFPTQSQGTGGEFNALPNNDVSSLLPTERDPQSNKTPSSYTLSNSQKNRKESPMPPALVPVYAYSPIHRKTGRISGYISHFGTNEPDPQMSECSVTGAAATLASGMQLTKADEMNGSICVRRPRGRPKKDQNCDAPFLQSDPIVTEKSYSQTLQTEFDPHPPRTSPVGADSVDAPVNSEVSGDDPTSVTEQSASSIASSSPQLLHERNDSYTTEQRCPTPSTVAYTHSSAMEDSESGDSDSVSSLNAARPGRNSVNGRCCDAPPTDSSSQFSDASASISEAPSSISAKSLFSSPSTLSSAEDDWYSTANLSDTERTRAEKSTTLTSALTQFTSRLVKILRRVEEIDLLKVVAEVGAQQTANEGTTIRHGANFHESLLLPEAARLSRHELSSLYSESAQIRLEGSMYSIPTGRLVRFLTLLLVNMQAGVSVSPQPITHKEAVRFLELRLQQKRKGSELTLVDHVTESLLWSSPCWASILTGLDCARTALNIIVAPDMPRPLLMEDLVDGVVSVVKYALENVLFSAARSFSSGATRNDGHSSGLSTNKIWDFTVDCVGFRVSQLMATLSSLLRFQPNRFTDNLVIRFTWLGLSVPLRCLKTGQSIDRSPKRLTSPLYRRILSSNSVTSHSGSHANMPTVGASRLWLLVWPGHLQRSSLSLLSGVYGQYEAHRKLIVDEIFAALLSHRTTPSATAVDTTEPANEAKTSGDRRATRTFRLISFEWLYAVNKYRKQPKESLRNVKHFLFNSTEVSTDSCFLQVHAVTALFLSLTQSLIQTPGSSPPSASSGGSSTSFRKASTSSSEQANAESSHFNKDEKHVLASYNTCVRHAHYLLSGLIKKACTKSEMDLRPVLETVSSDLLAVASVASVEWPAAFTLINVLSGLAIQNINQNGSHNNGGSNSSAGISKSVDLSTKLTCLDILSVLAIGLKRYFPLQSYLEKSTIKPESSCRANSASHFRTLSAQAKLVGYISSPMPVLQNWLLQPGVINSGVDGGILTDPDSQSLSTECMKWIRLELIDPLLVSTRRFFLASWLYYCNRELSETTSDGAGGDSSNAITSHPKSSKRVHELEKLRHQFLSELALTHTVSLSSLPWLTGSKQPGAVVGSSSLSSPTCSGRSSRGGSVSQLQSVGTASCPAANKFLCYGGSILADRVDVQRFVSYAHTRHLDAHYRLLLAAHAFWSLGKLSSVYPSMPRFEKLLGVIVRLVSESSVPVRTKALRCLASIVELDPNLFSTTGDSSDRSQPSAHASVWLRDLPKLVHPRLLDNSTAVREAAVDLVSRILVARPRMLSEYYPMLAERILDKGVSVRKRVIRCFRDLLLVDWSGEPSESQERSPKRSILLTRQFGVEMCLKLIRRLHDDEESIKKLVIDLFHNLWFTPVSESHSKLLNRRVINFCAVTSTMRANNFDSLESFVKQILATDDPTKREQLDRACRQLSRHQIKLIGRLSTPFSVKHPTKQRKQLSSSSLPPPNLQSVLASLHLISRCTPSLFIEHLDFLLDLLHKAPTTPVLSSATSVSSGTPRNEVSSGMDVQCLFHLINTTEVLLQSVAEDIDNKGPHATDSFLDRLIHIKLPELQRDLIRLIQRQGRVVVDSSFSCLATLTNRVLKEHTQVAACFGQFYGLLINLSFELQRALSTKVTNSTALSSRTRPSVLRALYTVGLMCKHFRLEDLTGDCDRVSTSAPVLDEVVDTLMLFAEYAAAPVVIQPSASGDTAGEAVLPAAMNDPDLCRKAVMGLGFLVSRHDQLLCTKRLSTFFSRFLVAARPGSSKPTAFHEVQYIILDNLMHYFLDMEREMVENSQLWASIHKSESLKELSDRRSGHGSAVAQEYLPLILRHCVLTSSANVRTATLGLISIILRQGLVHPVQTVSALICFQTDPDAGNRTRASHLLLESERKVPGFVAMRAPAGVYMSYHLHLLLHLSALDMNHSPLRIPIIRGFAPENTLSTGPVSPGNNAQPTALNHAVYTILRSNRQSRRSFISSLLSSFVSDQKTTESSDLESVLSGLLSSNVPHDPLGRLIFLSDQLAHFPYATQDEVLYVAFTVERLVSDCGPALLRIVQHALLSSLCNSESPNPVDEEEEKGRILRAETELHNLLDSVESKLAASCKATDAEDVATSFDWDEGGRLQKLLELSQPSSLRQKSFKSVLRTGPVCFLLLAIREHLRDVYGVTDSKLKDYSPTDSAKQWDKPVQPAKRSQAISQVLQLPLLVLQCMKTPGWLDGSVVPPAKVILFHFVQLRYRLLALEGGHLSEPSIPSCPESSTKWEAEESECKAIEHNMGAAPPKSDTSSPAASYPSVPCPKKIDEPSHPSSSKSVLHANATGISSRPTRGSKDFHSSAHPGNHSGRPSARTFGSHKRKPASSSTSSSSSLSSCSSLSSKPESSVARVSLKESNRFPAGDKRTKTGGSRVPRARDEVRSTVHLQSSKPNLNASNRSPKPSNRDGSVPKRLSAPSKKYIPSHLSSTSSSSDLETDGSNRPIPPRSAPKTLSKNSQKLDRSSHTKAPRSLNSGSHSLNGTSKASSSAYRLSDTSRHSLPPKSCDRVRIPEENDKKPQSKDGRRDGDLQSKQHDKPCRPPNSMRTLAPLPNAMMQSRRAPPSAHVSSKRRAPPGKTAPKLPPDLKNPLCGHSGPRNACSSPVRSGHLSNASSSSRTTASAAANRPTKIETDRKPQPSRLSDSSSLSSDSAAEADKHSAHSSISSSSSVSSVSTTSSSSECTLCSSPPSSSGPPPTKVKNFRKPPR